MVEVNFFIWFYLNGNRVELRDFSPFTTVLDYLRLDCSLTGSKEGCAEGDCGACSVLLGRYSDKRLRYNAVNSCIIFLPAINGCHIVTIEYLQSVVGDLHPIQQAMVDYHGSQCGFCTPGIVMSLYGLLLQDSTPNVTAIETALQGNLCRCTGYAPIIRAVQSISNLQDDRLLRQNNPVDLEFAAINRDAKKARVELRSGDNLAIIPASVDDLAAILLAYPAAVIIAGSTDVGLWVTKAQRSISPAVFINHLDELRVIKIQKYGIFIGAAVTYAELHAVIVKKYPHLNELWRRIGGAQVRNVGTIVGNIANGSPIGDTPPALIALGARMVLRHGGERRNIAIEDFFIDYGRQDRRATEFIESIFIPKQHSNSLHAVYKISKRYDEDISSICVGFNILVFNGIIQRARIVFGGMAGIIQRATAAEEALIGAHWSEEAFTRAAKKLTLDFTPLTDMRATREYRLLVSRNMFKRFYLQYSNSSEPHQLNRNAL